MATAVTVVLTLLNPPGGVQRKKAPLADAARCAQGQTSECVGGTATVITAPAASAPR